MECFRKALSLLILWPALGLAVAPLSTDYTMGDLEALERQKNYGEFLAHARDIRPSERGPVWVEMVAEMAEGFILSKISVRDFSPETLKEVEKL